MFGVLRLHASDQGVPNLSPEPGSRPPAPIGRVVATELKPSTPHQFYFWTARVSEVGIGAIVRVVTDRRIIYKEGFITRHTVEINMDKVASVDVDQSILGRLLDYGMVHVIGTGGAQNTADPNLGRGIERHRVASPLALRSAITAK